MYEVVRQDAPDDPPPCVAGTLKSALLQKVMAQWNEGWLETICEDAFSAGDMVSFRVCISALVKGATTKNPFWMVSPIPCG